MLKVTERDFMIRRRLKLPRFLNGLVYLDLVVPYFIAGCVNAVGEGHKQYCTERKPSRYHCMTIERHFSAHKLM